MVKWLLPAQREKLRLELLYLQHLEDHSFPAAYYVQAPNNAFIYQEADAVAVVMKKCSGQEPHPGKEVNKHIGSTLALLHTLPVQALPKKESWLNKAYLSQAIESVKSRISPDVLEPALREYQQVRQFDPAQFPQAIVHGDLVPHNCLFQGNELSVVLDWEEVCIGAAVQDFAVCVLNFCFSQHGFELDLYHALYEGYTSVRSLSVQERSVIEQAVKYMGITGSVTFLVQYGSNYPDEDKPAYQFYWRLGLDRWTLRV